MPNEGQQSLDARLRRAFDRVQIHVVDKEGAASENTSRRAIRALISRAERDSAARMRSELERRRAEVVAPSLNPEFLNELHRRHADLHPQTALLSASSVRVRSFSSSAEPLIQEMPINLGPAAFYQYGVAEAEGSGWGWNDSILAQGFFLTPIILLALDGSGHGDAGAASAAYWFDFTPPSDGEYEFRSLVMALGTYELESHDSPIYSKEAKGWVVAKLTGRGETPEDSFYSDSKVLFERRVARVAETDQLLGIEWVEATGFCRSGVKVSLLVDINAVAYARGDGSRARIDLSQAGDGCFVCTGVWVTKIG